MTTAPQKAALDLSAAGLLGAYLGLVAQFPEYAQLIPMWAVCVAIFVAMLARGIYRALKNDGKITMDEAIVVLGLAKEDAALLAEVAKTKPHPKL